MAVVSPVITGYFDLDAYDDTLFTIEHATLGLLDTGGVLGGDLATDISGYGHTITINRGRSLELDDITAGTCRITAHNYTRELDPSYTSGQFYGQLQPGKRLEVSIYGQTIFAGFIDDLDNSYDPSGAAGASILAVDNLGKLGRREFDAWTASSQLPGARLNAILDRNEVRFVGGRDFDIGVETLQGDSVSWGSNVLNYCQLVARSDWGRFFDSRTGVLTFRDRLSLAGSTPTLTFADDGTGYEFSGVVKRTAAELLYSIVSVDREGGTAQTVITESAITNVDVRRLSVPGLLLTSDARSLELANFLAGIYGTPQDRIAGLTVNVSAYQSEADQALVSSLDIGDVIRVVWTPLEIGNQLDKTMVVDGVSHQISAHGGHVLTLSLSDLAQASPFIIEDDVLGLLDVGGVLAF